MSTLITAQTMKKYLGEKAKSQGLEDDSLKTMVAETIHAGIVALNQKPNRTKWSAKGLTIETLDETMGKVQAEILTCLQRAGITPENDNPMIEGQPLVEFITTRVSDYLEAYPQDPAQVVATDSLEFLRPEDFTAYGTLMRADIIAKELGDDSTKFADHPMSSLVTRLLQAERATGNDAFPQRMTEQKLEELIAEIKQKLESYTPTETTTAAAQATIWFDEEIAKIKEAERQADRAVEDALLVKDWGVEAKRDFMAELSYRAKDGLEVASAERMETAEFIVLTELARFNEVLTQYNDKIPETLTVGKLREIIEKLEKDELKLAKPMEALGTTEGIGSNISHRLLACIKAGEYLKEECITKAQLDELTKDPTGTNPTKFDDKLRRSIEIQMKTVLKGEEPFTASRVKALTLTQAQLHAYQIVCAKELSDLAKANKGTANDPAKIKIDELDFEDYAAKRFAQYLAAFPKKPEPFVAVEAETHTGGPQKILGAIKAQASKLTNPPAPLQLLLDSLDPQTIASHFGDKLQITNEGIDAVLNAAIVELAIDDHPLKYANGEDSKGAYCAFLKTLGEHVSVASTQNGVTGSYAPLSAPNLTKLQSDLLQEVKAGIASEDSYFSDFTDRASAEKAIDRIYENLGQGLDRYQAIIEEEKGQQAAAATSTGAAVGGGGSGSTAAQTGDDSSAQTPTKTEPVKVQTVFGKVQKNHLGGVGVFLTAIGLGFLLTSKETKQEEGQEQPTESRSTWKLIVGGLAIATAAVAAGYYWRGKVVTSSTSTNLGNSR